MRANSLAVPHFRYRRKSHFHTPALHQSSRRTNRLSPVQNFLSHARNVQRRPLSRFGVLCRNFFSGSGGLFDADAAVPEPFVTPGMPRAVWLALRYEMDRK